MYREPPPEEVQPVVRLRGIGKSFGPTRANDAIDLAIAPGEVVGLVGANGAGKSTLMRVICGLVQPDEGSFEIAGETIDFTHYSPNAALARGIRIVHQELSLCANLTVTENFMLEEPAPPLAPASGWRSRFRERARRETEEIFPGVGLRLDARVEELRIGQRQVVEISRAAATGNLRLLVLDEPTSSLDAGRSGHLREWVRNGAAKGAAFIFISHKLHEILDVATRVVVMRNGRVVWDGAAERTSVATLVEQMGGHPPAVPAGSAPVARQAENAAPPLVTVAGVAAGLNFRAGEIIGLAGLDGNGQRPFLHAVRRAGRRGVAVAGISCAAEPGFVSGDRRGEGVFPLWSVLENIVVGGSVRRNLLGIVSATKERRTVDPLLDRLRIVGSRLDANILELSGGNQQKTLVARALMHGSRILLLDDPTRGVDVETKQEFYRLVREIAAEGALVIWYSTEDAELLECSRVLVFRDGQVTRELRGGEISEEAIVACSFIEPGGAGARGSQAHAGPSFVSRLVQFAPAGSLVVLLVAMVALNPETATPFGADLLLSAAVPVVLVALGQMFFIGGSEIDLGIGPFAGLVSVLSATLLVAQPFLGGLAILLALAVYAAMGLLIELRRMPSIVVTLGASFVWTGCGYMLQPTPGGSSPAWLTAAFNWNVPDLPTSVALIVIAGIVAVLIDRTRAGVVLRGFGNDARALRQLGWSAAAFAMLRYAIAGCFAAAAGFSLTAINTASDINAGNAYTLLSIAAVVIGGCELLGGSTAPVGVVCGAVTLSLIGALLGLMGISTDYNAAVQGLLLLAILGVRGAIRLREARA
ncbi:ATP-binding cassette domain-containing protein [Rhodopila globiformis]|uniref:ATP-binding cassette domain-containing protein n=1 Tax=Rhodopila globiformis TaxID=1071 RepID=UPI0019582349|nr:ATP-binding cassette domain-containing protein [Rhodopila globiformis]